MSYKGKRVYIAGKICALPYARSIIGYFSKEWYIQIKRLLILSRFELE